MYSLADEPEDFLLLLRLFHLGDLAFVAVSIEKSGYSAANLYPYRVISDLDIHAFAVAHGSIP